MGCFRRYLLQLRALALPAVLAACASAPSPPPVQPTAVAVEAPRPRLVLAVVVDQLGSDSLHRLAPLLSDGAFAHARAHGRVLEEVVYPYAGTLTAPGHAAIYTGTVPSENGVSTNALVDRTTGKRRALVDDGQHAVIGAREGTFVGPGVLRVDTVADALKLATSQRGKVVSISVKDRSAVLPGGKKPDLVLWTDATAGFTTSTYYASERPAWLTRFMEQHPIQPQAVSWEVPDPERLGVLLGPDAAPGEGDYKGFGTTFPHRLAGLPNAADLWAHTPDATEHLLELAYESAQQLQLGSDDVPDLLMVSISGTDYSGHVFGPDSWEYADHLRRADRAILRLAQRLAERTQLAVLITSDHGAARLPERVGGAPAAVRIDSAALERAVNAALESVAGPGQWVGGYLDSYLYFSPAARARPDLAALRAAALAALRAQPGIAAVYDTSDLSSLQAEASELDQRALRSIDPATSGDFFVVVAPNAVPDIGMVAGAGTTHGSPWDYDTHVPVLMWGPNVTQGLNREPLQQGRVAPTLSALLGIAPPAAAKLPPLPGVTAPEKPLQIAAQPQ